MDVYFSFIFTYIFLTIINRGECSVSTADQIENSTNNKAISKQSKELPTSIELKDFAAGNSESASEGKSVLPEPPKPSEIHPYKFDEMKWLHQHPSYSKYIREVLGKKFFRKFSHEKERHPVSTVFQISQTGSERKSDEKNLANENPPAETVNQVITPPKVSDNNENPLADAVDQAITAPSLVTMTHNSAGKVFKARSELPISSKINSTFENQLEEPYMDASGTTIMHDSEAETEYYSMSDSYAIDEDETENVVVETSVHKVGARNDEKNVSADEVATKNGENDPLAVKEFVNETKENDDTVKITKTTLEKRYSPRIVKLEVPEHLAGDGDRILNAIDLERSFISRYFGFYNPEPKNKQKISSFINILSRESKGYEIRTARISEHLFKVLSATHKKSFCEEHVNGNVILQSKNLMYDDNSDVQSIMAVRKTVIYKWKLPSENITTVRCPIKPIKPMKTGEKTPSAIYVVPVVYDDEYKAPYTFIFTDCTREDNCNPEEAPPDKAVRLFALSRIDIDHMVERIKSKLRNVRADEMQPPPALDETVERTTETTTTKKFTQKSILSQEERPTRNTEEMFKKATMLDTDKLVTKVKLEEKGRKNEPVMINDLIEKYLKNPSDFEVKEQLRRILPSHKMMAIEKQVVLPKRQVKKRKEEPWLVKIVKHFIGAGKKKNNASVPKADFYSDKTNVSTKAHFLKT